MPPVERRLDNLERDVADIRTRVRRLDTIEKGVEAMIDRRVSDERLLPVPWKWVAGTATLISSIVIGVFVYYVNSVVPTQIAEKVASVQAQVNVIDRQLSDTGRNPNSEIAAVNEQIKALDKKLTDRIDDIYKSLVGTPRKLTSSLERSLPKRQEEAKAGFPVTRELLERASQKRVVLKPSELKRLALPLLNASYSDKEASAEAWATAKKFATYRTVVNRSEFGVPRPRAGQAENYFEGDVLNLGDRDVWKDTVFVDCRINISSAQARLVLDNVRFVNCDFQLLDETKAGKALVEAVLSSNGPAVSVPLLDHAVSNATTTS